MESSNVIYDNLVDHVMMNMIYQFGVISLRNKKVISIPMARTITRETWLSDLSEEKSRNLTRK
jgi:hypothetical protein